MPTDARVSARPASSRRAVLWRIGLAALVLAGLAGWLLAEGATGAFVTALVEADPGPVLLAVAIYPFITVARAVRFQVGLRLMADGGAAVPAAPLWPLVRVAAFHSVLASLAPMRLGELSLVPLLHRMVGTPLAVGSALLVVLRLIDLVVVLSSGLVALALLPAARAAVPGAAPIAAGAVAALMAGLAVAPWIARRLRVLTPFGGGRLGRLWQTLMGALAAQTPTRVLVQIGWTALVWGLIYAMAWLCANATAPAIGLAGGVAGGAATALASVLPVSTFANAGTFEAAWMLALIPAGLSQAEALATGILFHVGGLAGSVAMGGVALLGGWPRLSRPEEGTIPR
ncbi:flippase-like domain-containing protein [Roseospira marina]|uniref:Flippase-like domain-containing protein n=1 Tax=Roseospira marina TaxID=140057 RepID=A0A5M6IBP3_9PROT|nr:lysylphosphatidylglycerol synthase domain-containing protein [Roseospira marina]KAA5605028.1 flippase-like domain-containing protein [Roseospira marina]MBB4314960.1 uncharacterized membrane protein YbhN (UPF0104 family) [Roseospira marina]MBB5087960.1 uncharacterized membrane protein YbhN (UPF0104 family) [Roseospira marina]